MNEWSPIPPLSVFSASTYIKTSIPYSQPLRATTIWSSEKDFKTHILCMVIAKKLSKRYREEVVNNPIDKAVFAKNYLVKKTS